MSDEALKAIQRSSTREELFAFLRDYYRAKGFDALCYMVPSATIPGRIEMEDFGYPADWIAKYNEGLGIHDPIVSFSMETARIFRWGEVGQHRPLGKDSLSFLDELSRSSMTDGLALPTYGRAQRVGYFGIGQTRDETILEHCDVLRLHAVAQRAHARLDEFAEAERPVTALSPREREILHWIARGKSNNDLATILGISAATVATYLQRVFAKLGTADRVTAVVIAAKQGLIHV